MTRIIDLFKDPVWVFSSIFLALTLNVVSSYLRDHVDSFRRRLSVESQKKKEARKLSIDRMAMKLKGKPEERMHLHFMQLYAMLTGSVIGSAGVFTAVIAAFSLSKGELMPGIPFLCFGLFGSWLAYRNFRIYLYTGNVLVASIKDSEIWKNEDENQAG